MSELQLLFLVLVCLYCWECACWLRRGSIALLTWLGRSWRAVHPGSLVGNQYGGFILAAPLPPLGNIVTTNQFPLSLSPDAALACVPTNVNTGWRPPQSGRFNRFDEIKTVAARGRKVLVNGKLWLRAASLSFAQFLARTLQQLQKAPPAERAKLIDKLFRDSLDTGAIERRWAEFRKRARLLRWPVNLLFLHLFVAIPLAIRFLGLKLSWIGLLSGLLTLTLINAILFWRAHKALYPEAEADDERFSHFLMVLLAPATSVRAQDILSRPLLETFHPLAVIRVFCSREEFQRFAARLLLELRFPALPLAPTGVPGAETTEQYSRTALLKNVEAFLLRQDLDPEELVRPPAPADNTCRTYCPRCRAQFTVNDGTCPDCGGLPLMAFAV